MKYKGRERSKNIEDRRTPKKIRNSMGKDYSGPAPTVVEKKDILKYLGGNYPSTTGRQVRKYHQ